MDAIIFADRHGEELNPLHNYHCPAMLPLLGKPLLQHAIEECHRAGISRAFLVVDANAEKLKCHFKHGEYWGIELVYLYSRQGQDYSELLRQQGHQLTFPALAMRGDIIYKSWLHETQSSTSNRLLLSQGDFAQTNDLALSQLTNSTDLYPLLSLQEVHQVLSFAVEQQNTASASVSRKLNDHVRLGANSDVHLQSLAQGQQFISEHSLIMRHALLIGTCYIGNQVIIDNGSTINNSVVLDNTFVGKGLNIDNALVCEHWIYRADLDKVLYVDDPLLLSATCFRPTSSSVDRFIALILLAICLPVIIGFLLGAFLAFAGDLKPVVSRHWVRSNKTLQTQLGLRQQTAPTWRFSTPFPWFNRLPMLWLVIKGHIRLFGTNPAHIMPEALPCKQNSFVIPPWHENYQSLPVGMISLAQVINSEADKSIYELQELEFNCLKSHTAFEYIKHNLLNRWTKSEESLHE